LLSTEYTKNIQSLVLEDFEMSKEDPKKPKRYWKLVPDRFGRLNNRENGPSLQKLAWVKAWPEAYFGNEGEFFFGTAEDANNPIAKTRYTDVSGTCLALEIKFNRQGYNSVELYPVEEYEKDKFRIKPIPFKGKVEQIDFWVWGANFDYFMEVVLIDYRGVEHRLNVGSIKHIGWKNFILQIPKSIPQRVEQIPSARVLSFVKFVIWTNPGEKVSGAHIYIDHIKYLTDVFEEIYDGYQLGNPKKIKEIWDNGVNVDVKVDNNP
jgi:hypothetical protein